MSPWLFLGWNEIVCMAQYINILLLYEIQVYSSSTAFNYMNWLPNITQGNVNQFLKFKGVQRLLTDNSPVIVTHITADVDLSSSNYERKQMKYFGVIADRRR